MTRVRTRNTWMEALFIAVMALPALALPALALEVGDAAPVLELQGPLGVVSVGAPGKVTYVDFWASWCGPCRQSFPWMNRMRAKYDGQALEIIGVNLDAEAKDAADFLEQLPATFTIVFDSAGDSARRYGVKGMPTSLIIGRDGRIFFQHQGFNRRDEAELERQIEAAIEGGGS